MFSEALPLIKARKGISTNVRDTFLTAIINAVVNDLLKDHKIILDEMNPSHLMFVADYAEYRYSNKTPDMPRHLKWRLHNLIIGGGSNV